MLRNLVSLDLIITGSFFTEIRELKMQMVGRWSLVSLISMLLVYAHIDFG